MSSDEVTDDLTHLEAWMKQQEPESFNQLKCWCLNVQQTRSQRKCQGLFMSHLLETVYKQAGRRLVSSAGE